MQMCPMYMFITILEIQCPELICHHFETIITDIFRALTYQLGVGYPKKYI